LLLDGFYSNDSDDLGGETVYGISRNNWSGWSGWKLIDTIKETNPYDYVKKIEEDDTVKIHSQKFYKDNFWDNMRLDDIDDKFPKVKNKLFEASVNLGSIVIVKMLQSSLNLLNKNDDLVVDGLIGNMTISSLNAFRGSWEDSIIDCISGEQYLRYKSIVENNPKMIKYFRGWIKRTRH
jgi:lysozyme family protein